MKIATKADISAFEAIPLSDRDWSTSTYEALTKQATLMPSAPALSSIADADRLERSMPMTFEQLLGRVTQMANLLHRLGNGVPDVTAYLLPNLIGTQITLWAAQAAGVAFPINTLLSPDHVVALLQEAKARILVTAPARPDEGWHGWESLRSQLRECSDLRHVLLIGQDGVDATFDRHPDGSFMVSDLGISLKDQPQDVLVSGRAFSAEDVSSYFCTGGTTGRPKLAIRTHGSEAVNAHMFAAMLGDGLDAGRLLVGLPLFHVNAAMTSLMTWLNGGEVVLAGRGYRDPEIMANFWRIVEKNGINYFSAVPTILSDLLTRSINADVSSLRFAICGAAPLSVELFTRFEKATGLKILEGYGLTESSCGASVNPYHGERRIGSVGMRLPYEDMLCVQLDNQGHFQCDCAPGEVGIVALRGPHIFSGYSDSTHEQELWIDRGEGARWLNTGDLGRIDEDGYLWLVGRRKDLIIRGGHNIDPKMIEEALYRHDAVQHAVAIGRPDARLGEVPVAYVTLQPGATVTGEELKVSAAAFISDRVAIPRDVIVVPEMPLTPVGKISKVALVEREIRTIVANISRRLSCNLTHLETETTSGGQIVRVEGASDELIRELKAFPFTVEQVRSSAA